MRSSFAVAAAATMLAVPLSSAAQTPAPAAPPIAVPADRAADAALIRAHIASIFQAFIDKDLKKLEDTHGKEWRGFTTGSRRVIRGRDGYMRNATGGARAPNGQGMVAYEMSDFDVVFYGDTAVASFVADLKSMNGTAPGGSKLVLVDVYHKEPGGWIQVASNTSYHPEYMESQTQRRMSTLRPLGEQERALLLKAREAVWRAWFTGDTATLAQLLPQELVTLGGNMENWGTFASNMDGAHASGRAGTQLTRLEFPRTEIQTYGNTSIIYTSYSLDSLRDGKTSTQQGVATEVFVWRDGRWINTGWQLAPIAR